MNRLRKIPCPLCNKRSYKVLFKSTLNEEDFSHEAIVSNLKNTLGDYTKHAQIVQCKSCSMVYTNPTEDPATLLDGYGNVIDDEYLAMEKYRKIILNEHLQKISQYKQSGRILDVGSFAGFFLEIAREKNWDVYGIEPSSWANKIAIAKGVKILGDEVNSTRLKKHYFDVITLWDVIEHLSYPKDTLKILRKSLKDGGLIAIGTHDIESVFAKLLGPNCPFLIRMHVTLFSKRTLRKLLEETGFTIVHESTYGRVFPLSYFLDRIQNKGGIFRMAKMLLRKLPLNFPIRLNLGESMLFIAVKNS